jgi:hypothetical protein
MAPVYSIQNYVIMFVIDLRSQGTEGEKWNTFNHSKFWLLFFNTNIISTRFQLIRDYSIILIEKMYLKILCVYNNTIDKVFRGKQILIIIRDCPIRTDFLTALSLNTFFQSKWWDVLTQVWPLCLISTSHAREPYLSRITQNSVWSRFEFG